MTHGELMPTQIAVEATHISTRRKVHAMEHFPFRCILRFKIVQQPKFIDVCCACHKSENM